MVRANWNEENERKERKLERRRLGMGGEEREAAKKMVIGDKKDTGAFEFVS